MRLSPHRGSVFQTAAAVPAAAHHNKYSLSIYPGDLSRQARDPETTAAVEAVLASLSRARVSEAAARAKTRRPADREPLGAFYSPGTGIGEPKARQGVGKRSVEATTRSVSFLVPLRHELPLHSCLRPAGKPRGPKKIVRFASPPFNHQPAPSISAVATASEWIGGQAVFAIGFPPPPTPWSTLAALRARALQRRRSHA